MALWKKLLPPLLRSSWPERAVLLALLAAAGAGFAFASRLDPTRPETLRYAWLGLLLLMSALLTLLAILFLHIFRQTELARSRGQFHCIMKSDHVYRAMEQCARRATKHIRTTHVRNHGFHPTPASAKYQKAVSEWPHKAAERRLDRIISRGVDSILNSAQQMIDSARAAPIGNYQIRGIRWPLDVPMVNLAIFDDSDVFVCFYDKQETEDERATIHAIHVTGAPEVVQRWIRYFDALWNDPKAMRITEASDLKGHDRTPRKAR